ncbi:hypothetical protein [Bacillus sp. MMSF_3328]|uniref:hypothetical protein n=1 Tax=Bacillus sp. MMSF_3328 TaxID=3047080 RepID=UPI00273EFA4F|nr:hypothetical protein [Bacillus sp. MMSF_3328]
MKKKTDLACEYWKDLNYKAALRLASEFRIGITEEERKQMKLGYECIVHEDFYRQLGKDIEKEVDRAIEVFFYKIYVPYKERTA